MQIQQPKKCRNGRYRFEDEIKINNTDALSKFEEDEYPSENLENHIIKAIVERNHRTKSGHDMAIIRRRGQDDYETRRWERYAAGRQNCD